MRWILRHVVLALCFSLGSTAWYILAQQESTPVPLVVQTAGETTVNQTIALAASDEPEVVPGQSITFGPVEPMTGYANAQTVILRAGADANASVVARLEPGELSEPLEILGARGDFLHVRVLVNKRSADGEAEEKHEYKGWATWGSVVPEMGAIVLDTETGAVVSRVPLSEGLSSVIFSPGGSRAIFSGESSGVSQKAYEVRTSDYTLTRSLKSSGNEPFSAVFYALTGDDVYAKVFTSKEMLIRIGDGGAENTPTDLAPNILVSPDGLTGLIMRREEDNDLNGLLVNVLEMTTLEVRNTFKLSGSNLSADGGGCALSRDGAKLYMRTTDEKGAILVFDTRTGQLLQEFTGSNTQGWFYFSQGSVVGDSLLLRVWDESEDEMEEAPKKIWLSSGKRTPAEAGVDYAVEANGKRYAINEEGTLLFRLNDNNRIQKRFRINRPEQREDALVGNDLTVFNFTASPDGKHLILFVGIAHGC